MRPTTAIAISGGIDSLVAGYLLKREGHDVIGIHFVTGYETGDAGIPSSSPNSGIDASLQRIDDASRRISPITDRLDIPLKVVDVSTDFQNRVVDYFILAYRSGLTPNPCLVCNPSIKFDVVLNLAVAAGATRLATGHYARVALGPDGRLRLLRGLDRRKDQSYFLGFLPREKLEKAIFPLGEMTKDRVRLFAEKTGLKPVTTGESQDICFIRGNTYAQFVSRQPGFEENPGLIEDIRGNIIGEHRGLHRFTIGQRRGIDCPAPAPYYVVRLDRDRNRLVVGSREDLLVSECEVTEINWIGSPPKDPVRAETRIRYRHTAAPSEVCPLGVDRARVRFDNRQSAVTPGQGAVFYSGEEVLGGGFISRIGP